MFHSSVRWFSHSEIHCPVASLANGACNEREQWTLQVHDCDKHIEVVNGPTRNYARMHVHACLAITAYLSRVAFIERLFNFPWRINPRSTPFRCPFRPLATIDSGAYERASWFWEVLSSLLSPRRWIKSAAECYVIEINLAALILRVSLPITCVLTLFTSFERNLREEFKKSVTPTLPSRW